MMIMVHQISLPNDKQGNVLKKCPNTFFMVPSSFDIRVRIYRNQSTTRPLYKTYPTSMCQIVECDHQEKKN